MIKTNENYEMLWDFAEEAVSLSSALMFGIEDDAEHYREEKTRLYNELISRGFSKEDLDKLSDLCEDIGEFVVPGVALLTEVSNVYHKRVTGDQFATYNK